MVAEYFLPLEQYLNGRGYSSPTNGGDYSPPLEGCPKGGSYSPLLEGCPKGGVVDALCRHLFRLLPAACRSDRQGKAQQQIAVVLVLFLTQCNFARQAFAERVGKRVEFIQDGDDTFFFFGCRIWNTDAI